MGTKFCFKDGGDQKSERSRLMKDSAQAWEREELKPFPVLTLKQSLPRDLGFFIANANES